MEDVLQAVEDGFVIFDFSALGGICPLLTALEVGVHFTCVRGVLFVMCYLQTQMTQITIRVILIKLTTLHLNIMYNGKIEGNMMSIHTNDDVVIYRYTYKSLRG